MTIRVRRADPKNLVIEKFRQGGQIIDKGPQKGKVIQDKWIIVGYYGNFRDLAQALLMRATEDSRDIFEDTQDLINFIAQTEQNILTHVKEIH